MGWKPEVTFEDALEATVKWYVENEKFWAPYATQVILSPTPGK
jgi:dTDP-D-glucose 4,6-dehydratase